MVIMCSMCTIGRRSSRSPWASIALFFRPEPPFCRRKENSGPASFRPEQIGLPPIDSHTGAIKDGVWVLGP
jgi:hypothetical protein